MKKIEFKRRIESAIARVLVPIARLCLHFDISFNDFNKITKKVFVHVGFTYFKEEGKKTTASSVANLIDIPRQEVSKISKIIIAQPLFPHSQVSPVSNVLSGWLRNEKYTDNNNNPIPLVLKDQHVSFESLVTDYGKGEALENVLTELQAISAIEISKDNFVTLLDKSYIPKNDEVETLTIVTRYASDLLTTGLNNILHVENKNFQRGIIFEDVPLEIIEDFKTYSNKRSQDLLIEYNTWFYKKLQNKKLSGLSKKTKVGIGIFYYDDKNSRD